MNYLRKHVHRSQSEKQEAEIDSLKIKIDTQSIELNTIKRQSPQNLKETKKFILEG